MYTGNMTGMGSATLSLNSSHMQLPFAKTQLDHFNACTTRFCGWLYDGKLSIYDIWSVRYGHGQSRSRVVVLDPSQV